MTRLEQVKIELKELISKRDAEMRQARAQYTEDDNDAVMYATEMPAELTAEQQELKSKLAVIREKYSRIQQLAAEETRIENGTEDWNTYFGYGEEE